MHGGDSSDSHKKSDGTGDKRRKENRDDEE